MIPLKRMLRAALTAPVVTSIFAPFMRGRATIFALHRFRDAERRTPGHDPEGLRDLLASLRRQRYPLVGLERLFRWLEAGDPRVNRAVAFTLDDGYADQAAIAGPVFAEFDCPATVFLITGFLDGLVWPWWDRIEYAFASTARPALEIELGGVPLRYERDQPGGYGAAQFDFTERCKHVSQEEKEAAILRLAAAAQVALPLSAPAGYAPMSWRDVRAWEQRGLTFGAHTVTHPVLARVTQEQSRWEIMESWKRLQREARSPVPVFSYPSGQPWEYGARERETLRHLGLIGAVTCKAGHADARVYRRGRDARFDVPRFSFPDESAEVVQYVSGLERLRELVWAGPAA